MSIYKYGLQTKCDILLALMLALALLNCNAQKAAIMERNSECLKNPNSKKCKLLKAEGTNTDDDANPDFNVSVPATVEAGSVLLVQWEEVEGALDYTLYVGTDKTCSNPVITMADLTNTSQAISLVNPATYFVCVVANMPKGKIVSATNSGAEVVISGSSDQTVPTVSDATISASGVAETSLTVSWAKATDNTTAQASLQYLVYYSLTNNMSSVSATETNGTAVGSYATNIDSKLVSGLTPNTTYFFNVIVKDGADNKSIYTTSSQATLSDTTDPTVGGGGTLTTASVTTTSLDLNWTEATDNVSGESALQYRVYYSIANNISSVANAETNGTAANAYTADIDTLFISSLTHNTTYYFNVIVKDAAGRKAIYTTKQQATLADTTPPVPGSSGTITTASVATTSLTLNWTKANDALSLQNTLQYLAYRSASNNISTVTDAETNGTAIGVYAADIDTKAVSGLSSNTTYYFNVIVKDQADNKAVYTTKSETTQIDPPPPALTSFTGATASNPGRVDLTVDFPADVSDYANVKIYRSFEADLPGGSSPPACGSGILMRTITNFAIDPLTIGDYTGIAGKYFSYRACIYDSGGNVTNTNTATDRLSASGPTLLRYLDAADINGDGTQNSGDSGLDSSTTWTGMSGSTNATLNSFTVGSNDANSGWDGVGSVADPYRLKFDGSNDYVSAGTFTPSTISVWFNPDVEHTSIGYIYHGSYYDNAYIYRGNLVINYNWDTAVGTSVVPGKWHHLVVTNNGTTTYFYLNGSLFATQTRGTSSSYAYELGKYNAGASNYFDGSIAEFRAYSTYLSATTVADYYNDLKPRFFSDPTVIQLTRLEPAMNATSGGSTLALWGWNLQDLASVTIDGNAATSVTVINNSKATVVVPAGSVGFKDVVLNNGSATDTATNAFNYTATTTSGLLAALDAKNVDAQGVPAAGTLSNDIWESSANGARGSLYNFTLGASSASSGWNGDGSTGNPHRLQFDGTNDYVAVGNMAPQTISVWFNADTFHTTLGHIYYGSYYNYACISKGTLAINYNWDTSVSVGVTTGSWNHLVVTNNTTNTYFYLNGSLVGTQSRAVTGTTAYVLGRDQDNQSNYFDGSIAEFRAYSGYLSASAVGGLYNEMKPRFSTDPGTMQVTRIEPAVHATGGGATMTIWGWNLADLSTVTVDGNAAGSLSVINNSMATVSVPAGSVGFKDLFLDDGTDNVTAAGAVNYTSTTTSGMMIKVDAQNVDTKGTSAAGTLTNNVWDSLVNGMRGALYNFTLGASSAVSGWNGIGTTGNPYRLQFDGSDDFVTIGRLNQPQTLSLWFNADTTHVTSGSLVHAGYYTHARVQNSTLYVTYNTGNELSTAITPGTWYHLVIANNGTTTTFYLNGSSFNTQGSGLVGNDVYALGRDPDNSNAYFDGGMAEFRAYSGYLDSTAVTALWNEIKGRFGY